MAVEIKVPVLGESVVEATVAKWMKSAGEAVGADEAIVELETDKVTLEVPSPVNGVLADIVAKEGDTVGVDALLALVEEGAAPTAKPSAKTAPAPAATAAPAPAATAAPVAPAVVQPTALPPATASAPAIVIFLPWKLDSSDACSISSGVKSYPKL